MLHGRKTLVVALVVSFVSATRPLKAAESEYVAGPTIYDDSYQDYADGYASTGGWTAGVELVFARPQWEGNLAFTTLEANGLGSEWSSDTELDYDFALAPRLWLGYEHANGIGVRARYWQFDQSANSAVGVAPANGFGKVLTPELGSVDITAERPGDSLTIDSGLDTRTIDLEVTKDACLGAWHLVGVAGLRYASIRQDYTGRLRRVDGVLLGSIDYEHEQYGLGPTFGIESRRGLFGGIELFAGLRASLLFGDANATLNAIEDQDLNTPAFTEHTSSRHDLLPIGELQIGADWKGPCTRFGQLFLRGSLEGQLWSGVGNASSEDGDLAFLGATIGGGISR